MTAHVDGNYGLGITGPCSGCGSMPIQATDMYPTMLSIHTMMPDLEYSHSPLGQAETLAHPQEKVSIETSPQRYYDSWDCENDWEHRHQYTG
jgi:hypothetical protein